MLPRTNKRCSRCQTAKPAHDFHRGDYRCKPCAAEYVREWRKANPEKWRAQSRRHREKVQSDPERAAIHRDYQREYFRENYAVGQGDRFKVCATVNANEGIDAASFRDWLLSIRPNFETVVDMATSLGINDSTLAKVMNGTKATVSFSTVDRALCGYGRPDLLDRCTTPKDEDEAKVA